MRLYRAELYKLCHKKTFLIGSVITALIMLVYFLLTVTDQITTVNGVTYHGYEAVRIDRQITEAYRGELTDEKVWHIVEEYGLPSKVEEGYGWWRDANYLNGFVADYLSDGFIMNWDSYHIPTGVYAIADTKLGKIQEARGEAISVAYTTGWQVLFDTLEVGMMPASVLVIIGISIVFAQESETGMLPLLFTTQDGKEKDARMKIAAAFTLTIMVYSVAVLSVLVLCGCVFGLDGGDCPMGLAVPFWKNIISVTDYIPSLWTFMWIVIGFDFLAMMLLCAIIMCISAYCSSTFGAVTRAVTLWMLPTLIATMFGGLLYLLATSMPIALIMTNVAYETITRGRTTLKVVFTLALFVVCVEKSYRVYIRQS